MIKLKLDWSVIFMVGCLIILGAAMAVGALYSKKDMSKNPVEDFTVEEHTDSNKIALTQNILSPEFSEVINVYKRPLIIYEDTAESISEYSKEIIVNDTLYKIIPEFVLYSEVRGLSVYEKNKVKVTVGYIVLTEGALSNAKYLKIGPQVVINRKSKIEEGEKIIIGHNDIEVISSENRSLYRVGPDGLPIKKIPASQDPLRLPSSYGYTPQPGARPRLQIRNPNEYDPLNDPNIRIAPSQKQPRQGPPISEEIKDYIDPFTTDSRILPQEDFNKLPLRPDIPSVPKQSAKSSQKRLGMMFTSFYVDIKDGKGFIPIVAKSYSGQTATGKLPVYLNLPSEISSATQ